MTYISAETFSTSVAGDSLLIHACADTYYSLVSVALSPNVTSYPHSCHLIKLIHCGTPQKDVLSDKMVL